VVSASFTPAIQMTPAQAAKIASKTGRPNPLNMRDFHKASKQLNVSG
jgi:hypothetical protein